MGHNMSTIHVVTLEPKTGKGRNKINEAGKPEHWIVQDQRESVGFSERDGPWLLIQPANNAGDKSRWVNLVNDNDFVVTVVR